jgi:hypothetical protein
MSCVIRLGSLAGYPFEGPRLLAGWTAPPCAAVYAVMCKTEPGKEKYAVIYVDHSDDLSAERFPFKHRRAPDWVKRAGDRYQLYVCTYEVPGGLRSHREQIARELSSIYRPSCNVEQYEQSWRAEWIGDYKAPTARSLSDRSDQARLSGWSDDSGE